MNFLLKNMKFSKFCGYRCERWSCTLRTSSAEPPQKSLSFPSLLLSPRTSSAEPPSSSPKQRENLRGYVQIKKLHYIFVERTSLRTAQNVSRISFDFICWKDFSSFLSDFIRLYLSKELHFALVIYQLYRRDSISSVLDIDFICRTDFTWLYLSRDFISISSKLDLVESISQANLLDLGFISTNRSFIINILNHVFICRRVHAIYYEFGYYRPRYM